MNLLPLWSRVCVGLGVGRSCQTEKDEKKGNVNVGGALQGPVCCHRPRVPCSGLKVPQDGSISERSRSFPHPTPTPRGAASQGTGVPWRPGRSTSSLAFRRIESPDLRCSRQPEMRRRGPEQKGWMSPVHVQLFKQNQR